VIAELDHGDTEPAEIYQEAGKKLFRKLSTLAVPVFLDSLFVLLVPRLCVSAVKIN
jgi:hypothetical protein